MRVPRLTALLTICFGFVGIALTAFVATVVTFEASNSMTHLVERELAQLSKQASDRIDRYMFERWSDVHLLADQMSQVNGEGPIRRMMGRLKTRYSYAYAWIGYTTADCSTILYSADGSMEGLDASNHLWCQRGRIAPFVGDMRFTRKLRAPDGKPYAVIDIAMPVFDRQGVLKGVVAAYVDASYLYTIQRGVQAEIAEGHPTESFVVARDGTISAGPSSMLGKDVSPELLSKLRTQKTGIREDWPDGGGYVAGAAVAKGVEDYPGLGWTVVTRGEEDDALTVVRELRDRILIWGAGLSALSILLAFLLARWIGGPLHRLAAAAKGDMNLDEARSRRFREISELTRALNHRFNNMQMANEALVLANHRTTTALHDRETLLKEVHHRVKNNLQVIISTLRLQGSRIRNSPSTKGVVERLTNRVQVLGWLYSKLYEQAIFEHIEARTVLEPLIEQIHQTYYCDVAVEVSIDDAKIGFDQTLVLGMIVIELLSNALCHAYPTFEGRVVVRLRHFGDGDYEFAVLDEGVSFDTTQKYAGVGLTLSQRMALQLGGPLEMVSDDAGTRMRIRFTLETPQTVLPGESRAA